MQRERTERTEDEKDRTKRVAVTAQVTQKQKRCDVHTEPQTATLNTQHKIVIYFNTSDCAGGAPYSKCVVLNE